MSLSDLANVGSFISGAGVLVSLIYLALQVRRAEKYQQAIMQQGRAARVSDYFMRLTDPALAAVILKGQSGDENLSPVEAQQLFLVVRAVFLGFEDSFLQQRAALLDRDAVESGRRAIKSVLAVPSHRAMWKILQSAFPPSFVTYVAKIDADLPDLGIGSDLLAKYRAALAEVKIETAPRVTG